MNIKVRLSFQFMLIAATVLVFFALLVYYFTFTTNREKFRNNLLNRAKNTAIMLIDVKEVDSTLLKKIHQSTISWQSEEIAVTDTNLRIIYSNNINDLSNNVFRSNISRDNHAYFTLAGKDGVFYRHVYKNKTVYTFVLAYDKARAVFLKELIQILFWSILFSLWLSVLFSYIFSKKAIKPISDIIDSVKAINSSNLGKRLHEGNRKDEIEQLAMTFNEMLFNLEIAFKNQQEFVSNASHELKTPVSVMIAESDYFLNNKHSDEEYRTHLSEMIIDLKKFNTYINSLLDLAQTNAGKSILFKEERLDEILYDAVHEIKNRYHNRKIVTKIHFPENDNGLSIEGHPGLLVIAIKNIIDNACKFSDEDVTVDLKPADGTIKLTISDSGIGIPLNEINDVFKPFNRASNARFKSGFGIGLSLVFKIMEIHHVEMEVFSEENKGTRFELTFKRSATE